MLNQLLHIIHKISLYAIKNLKGISLVQSMAGIRECLDTAMIRHSYCRHPPLLGPLDNTLYLGDSVHITHLCMAMELHPFFKAVVHALAGKILCFFDAHNRA